MSNTQQDGTNDDTSESAINGIVTTKVSTSVHNKEPSGEVVSAEADLPSKNKEPIFKQWVRSLQRPAVLIIVGLLFVLATVILDSLHIDQVTLELQTNSQSLTFRTADKLRVYGLPVERIHLNGLNTVKIDLKGDPSAKGLQGDRWPYLWTAEDSPKNVVVSWPDDPELRWPRRQITLSNFVVPKCAVVSIQAIPSPFSDTTHSFSMTLKLDDQVDGKRHCAEIKDIPSINWDVQAPKGSVIEGIEGFINQTVLV